MGSEKFEDRGKRSFVIENGHIELRASPEYEGVLYSIKEAGIEHLLSPYPEVKPFSWLGEWLGGICLSGWVDENQ